MHACTVDSISKICFLPNWARKFFCPPPCANTVTPAFLPTKRAHDATAPKLKSFTVLAASPQKNEEHRSCSSKLNLFLITHAV